MKILHITAQKPDSTGSGIYLKETVAAFSRLNEEQAVIAGINHDDQNFFEEDIAFFPVVFETEALDFPVVGMSDVMPYRATRYRDVTDEMAEKFKQAFRATFRSALQAFTPDLIICHHLYLMCSTLIHEFRSLQETNPELLNTKFLALSHSTDLRQFKQIDLEHDFIYEGINKLDGVLALHEEQKAEIHASFDYPLEQIFVVGTGFNEELFYPDLKRHSQNENIACYAGKIWRKKGVSSLIKAWEKLDQGLANKKLYLAGGYSDQAEYEGIVSEAQGVNDL
ncbi:MAG: glycosyltransferase, partial [Coriobacteriia bacterium]|nr:glycosyltransferase [Coriobacteriia bacterium]